MTYSAPALASGLVTSKTVPVGADGSSVAFSSMADAVDGLTILSFRLGVILTLGTGEDI